MTAEEKVIALLEDAIDGCAGCFVILLRSLAWKELGHSGPVWTLRLFTAVG